MIPPPQSRVHPTIRREGGWFWNRKQIMAPEGMIRVRTQFVFQKHDLSVGIVDKCCCSASGGTLCTAGGLSPL